MNTNIKIIVTIASLALVGTASAMAIKRAKNKKDETPTEDDETETNEPNSGGGTTSTWGNGCTNRRDTSAYGLKVMGLQKKVGIVGCDVDGIAGPQTNAAVKNKYPNLYTIHGAVKPENIDIYLAGSNAKVNALDYAKTIVSQVKQGKTAVIKDGNNKFVTAYQQIKPPNETNYVRSNLKTYIKTGTKYRQAEQVVEDGIYVMIFPQASDIYGGNSYYSAVRVLAKYVVIE
jgi:hypothetical protein